VGTIGIATLAIGVAAKFWIYQVEIPSSVHSLIEICEVAAFGFALVQYHDAHQHSATLKVIRKGLSNQYVGTFDVYLERVTTLLADAKYCYSSLSQVGRYSLRSA
jgi:hypothetical protein